MSILIGCQESEQEEKQGLQKEEEIVAEEDYYKDNPVKTESEWQAEEEMLKKLWKSQGEYYRFNCDSEAYSWSILDSNMQVVQNATQPAQPLTQAQREYLLTLLMDETMFAWQAIPHDCAFTPRMGFIFRDQKDKPLSSVIICTDCGDITIFFYQEKKMLHYHIGGYENVQKMDSLCTNLQLSCCRN